MAVDRDDRAGLNDRPQQMSAAFAGAPDSASGGEAEPPSLAVHALHALAYCERLFYLENVEMIRLADAAVYAGRRLHVELARDEDGEWHALTLESPRLGLKGKVDCLRRRDGTLIPYEHKRGRAARARSHTREGDGGSPLRRRAAGQATRGGEAEAWPSDRLQVAAYAMLVEEATGQSIAEGRVRYHQDNLTVRVAIDEAARRDVRQAIQRARELAASLERPPVAANERLCVRCSLSPACLPEEARLAVELQSTEEMNPPLSDSSEAAAAPTFTPPSSGPIESGSAAASGARSSALRLFPADDPRQVLHVLTQGARVGRAGNQLEITIPDEPGRLHPVSEVGQVVLHGFAQITTQALRLCADRQVAVHWVTQGGQYIGAFAGGSSSVQRRIRQYEALRDAQRCLELARRLTEARILSQLRFLLRASRGRDRESTGIREAVAAIRRMLPALKRATSADELRGVEGRVGALYFEALPALLDQGVDPRLRPCGRSRRPPRDRFNALLGFGYALLLKDVLTALLVVGLEPAFGFYHRPRSQAHPLALDLMELFRVAMVDIAIVAAINRRQWDAEADFSVTGQQVWLSESGRRKLIEQYERRKRDHWKHPVLGYSLSYARLLELEARLLEKEWTGEPGLFARLRLR